MTFLILILLLFSNTISGQILQYYDSILEVYDISLDLNGNFGTKSAWFFFDLLVTSDYMIPITQNLDNTTFNTNDPIEYFVRQNATVNIPNPAVIFQLKKLNL